MLNTSAGQKLLLTVFVTLIGSMLLNSTCHAQNEIRWINPAGGYYLDDVNWEGGITPTQNDTPVFDIPDNYQVILDTNYWCEYLRARSGIVVFNIIDNFAFIVSQNIIIGENSGDNVDFTFRGGILDMPMFITVGLNEGSIGKLTFDSGEANIDQSLTMGKDGNTILEVINGASLNLRNLHSVNGNRDLGSGDIYVTGVNSQINVISSISVGNGDVIITDSGKISTGSFSIGGNENEPRIVSITGDGSIIESDGDISIGSVATTTLTITDGGQVIGHADAYLGRQADGSGIAIVSGSGSQWVNDSRIHIGYDGQGSLRIENGGLVDTSSMVVSSRNSLPCDLVVTDPGSSLLGTTLAIASSSPVGSILLENGASITLTNSGSVGSHNSAFVRGANTLWTMADLYVGSSEINANLLVESEAAIGTRDCIIAGNMGHYGEYTIQNPGTTQTSSGYLEIGRGDDAGIMNILDGASVDAARVYIESYSTLNISTGSLCDINGEVYVGGLDQPGYLNINGGSTLRNLKCTVGHIDEPYLGAVSVTGNDTIWVTFGIVDIGTKISTGTIEVSNYARAYSKELQVGPGGNYNGHLKIADWDPQNNDPEGFYTNLLKFNAGGFVNDPDNIDVEYGGTITGAGTINADVHNIGGTLDPGYSLDMFLNINGSYTQDVNGKLIIDVIYTAGDEQDILNVTGDVSLAGELVVELSEVDFSVIPKEFVMISANSVTGTFDSVKLWRPNGYKFSIRYEADRVIGIIDYGMRLDSTTVIRGQQVEIDVTNAKPRSSTWLVYGFKGTDATYVPQLDVTLNVRFPTLGKGPTKTDALGNVTWKVNVPAGLNQDRVWLQAIQFRDASNFVFREIQ